MNQPSQPERRLPSPTPKRQWKGAAMARPQNETYEPVTDAENRRRRNIMAALSVLLVVLVCATAFTFYQMVVAQPSTPASAAAPMDAGPENDWQELIAKQPEQTGQVNILLLGSDQREGDGGYRTDVIILVTLDMDQDTVTAVSFPRDLWVRVPSLYEMKINQVHALGGFEAMAEMFSDNFGVTPDYYVLTNFDGFTQFIDNRGGVDVEVGAPLTDDCDLPQAVNGDCTVEPGTVHMDGKTALWYVRSRYTTDDLDRLRREQEVVYAIFKKLASLKSIAMLPQMKAEIEENVETNLTIEKGLTFLPLASKILTDSSRIHRYAINEEQATPSWSWDGLWILLPDEAAVRALLQQAGIKP